MEMTQRYCSGSSGSGCMNIQFHLTNYIATVKDIDSLTESVIIQFRCVQFHI